MHDLNDFLSESFQYRLKENAAMTSNSRFENTLQNYFNLFFDEFEKIKSSHDVDGLSYIKSKTKDSLYDWLDGAYDCLLMEINIYKELFKDLIYSYQLFIRGKQYHATLHIFDVIEKYDMSDVISTSELGLYYKGRVIREGDITNEDSYYYHIPFDKRFLIGNQRFSYSGQPILYVGSSILDVLYELRYEDNDLSKLAIASYGYDPLIEKSINQSYHKRFQKLKIYDVTNHIHKLINGVLKNFISQELNVPDINDPMYTPNSKDIKKDFKKFILTQICTFKRTHPYPFIEEYIPAQILTEALRINGYNGVKFPSTQFDNKNVVNNSLLHPSAVHENLALFANYSNTDAYDFELLKYFFVTPLDNNAANLKSVDEYKAEIKKLQNEIIMASINNIRTASNVLVDASSNVGKVHECESALEIEGKPYFNLEFAKIELYAQVNYLSLINDQIKNFRQGIQTAFPIK